MPGAGPSQDTRILQNRMTSICAASYAQPHMRTLGCLPAISRRQACWYALGYIRQTIMTYPLYQGLLFSLFGIQKSGIYLKVPIPFIFVIQVGELRKQRVNSLFGIDLCLCLGILFLFPRSAWEPLIPPFGCQIPMILRINTVVVLLNSIRWYSREFSFCPIPLSIVYAIIRSAVLPTNLIILLVIIVQPIIGSSVILIVLQF